MMNYLVFFCYHLSILGGTASSRPYFNNKNLEYRESILAHSSLRCSLAYLTQIERAAYQHRRLSPVLPYLDRESSQSKWQEKSVFGKGVLLQRVLKLYQILKTL
ncbi:hypothetical protein Bca101_089011 [Brassica carinata]